MGNFNKFQSIYKEITGHDVNLEEIPENLRDVFLNCCVRWTHPDDNEAQILNGRAQGTRHSSQLNTQEVAKLPLNIRIAYLVANKPSDDEILDKIKKQLTFYEGKYDISSEEIYRKYHNSEAIFEGSHEQVLDFLLWESNYERYLELSFALCSSVRI